MPMDDDIAWLGIWEGYRVCGVERIEGRCPEVWISLEAVAGRPAVCAGCGGAADSLHDVGLR